MSRLALDFGNKCPRCKGILITDEERGELLCSNCGTVAKDRIEEVGQEWRAFTLEEHKDRSRIGIPTSLAIHDMNLATIIGRIDRDASGEPISASMKSTMERLRLWDGRSKANESVDRNLRQAFSELHRLKDKLAVGDSVTEKTAYIYRKAIEKGLAKGRSISSLVVATLYAACRDTETTRTLREIANASNVKKKDAARCYRALIRKLDLNIPVADPSRCISRIANKVGLNEKIQRTALEIIDKARQKGIVFGKNPMGLAAAALYVASVIEDEAITQEKLADAAGITTVTVRKRCSELKRITKSGKHQEAEYESDRS